MGDGVHKTSSSLSKIINKQQQAYISCEETQTLFDYYVSSLQANLNAPCDVQADDSGPKDEADMLNPCDSDGQDKGAIPLPDFSRKRQRYQSPLETIEEHDNCCLGNQGESLRQTLVGQCEDPIRNAYTSSPGVSSYDGHSPRSVSGRSLKSGIRMLYHTEMWTPDDHHDQLHQDNALLMTEKKAMLNNNNNQYDVHTPARETNSFSDSNRGFKDHLELMSKIATVDGNQTEVCFEDAAVDSSHRATSEVDGAITVLPKLSVVDIQRCHVDETTDMKDLYNSALQELRSLQTGNQVETTRSDSTNTPAEKVADMTGERGAIKKHSRRKDAEKHLDMVREKQQRAKELFAKLKSINNSTIHNIALNSSIVLEASIKKVSLLSRSYSFEPEEVIRSTTQMLEDLTNLISTTSNQIRQIAKSTLAEGENLGIIPFLSGPRSISTMVSSTETLMSPVTFSSSSVEEDGRVNAFTAVAAKKGADSVTMTSVNDVTASTISGKEPRIIDPGNENQFSSDSDTDSEYEIFKSTDLISFVDKHNMMPKSCPQFVRTQEPLTNIMDAAPEELPGWQNTNNVQNDSSKKLYASHNATIDNLQLVTDGVPDKIVINNTRCTNDEHQNPNTSRTCPERHVISSETFAEHKSASQNVTRTHKIASSSQVKQFPQALQTHKQKTRLPKHGIRTRNRKPLSPGNATNYSTTQTANNSQQQVIHESYDTCTKSNVPRLCIDSTGTNYVHTHNKQLRNKSGQPINDQKRKSNTLAVNSKESKSVFTSKTDKSIKPVPGTKKVNLVNKTLERNVLNICEKINVLKSCVQNRNACFDGNVLVERMAAERDIGENVPLSSKLSTDDKQFGNKGLLNFNKDNANERSMRHAHNSSISNTKNPSSHPGKSTQDNTHQGTCENKGKVSHMNCHKTLVSSPVVTKEIMQENTLLKQGHTKGFNSNLPRKKMNADKINKHNMRLQTKYETHESKFVAESKKFNQRPKRLLTHQEIQSWINISHQNNHCQVCPLNSIKHHKRYGSPNLRNTSPSSVGKKGARENLRRSKSSSPSSFGRPHSSRSKRSKRSIDKPHVSDTSIISELGSTYPARCVERTASQLIMDTLSDAAQVGIKRSLSARPGSMTEKKTSQLSLKCANEIISKISNCNGEASDHASGIDVTINRLVTSLDKTIDQRCDKRVCWDSSTDIPPRGRSKSSSEETEAKIFETGSRVLETIAAQLMRKLSIEAESTACRDDPETEVSFNSKRNWDNISSSSLEGLISDYSRHSVTGNSENSFLRTPPISHISNVNTLLDVIKSTSDGYFSEHSNTSKRIVSSHIAKANHAMAALEDLQALLSSLKFNMNEQTRAPSRPISPLPPMRPKPKVIPKVKPKRTDPDKEVDPSSSEPEATIEKCGDTIITTTVRAPVKRPSQPHSSPLPTKHPHSSSNSVERPSLPSDTTTSSIHSSSSRQSDATGSSMFSDSSRSYSRLLPARAGYRMPSLYTNKSYGNLPSKPITPQQSSTLRINQNHKRGPNRKHELTSPSRRNKVEMHCGHSVSDDESVVSSSSCYSNRMHQLAQPKKRYLEATKDEHKHVLKRQYLERLQKRISMAEMKNEQALSKDDRTKLQARKRPINIEKPTDNNASSSMKPVSVEGTKTGTTQITDEETSSSDLSEPDDLSIHYNSPSEESVIVGVNDRQYYHYSDKSDFSSTLHNTVQYGEIVYVGVDSKPKPETPQKCVDTSTQEVKKETTFVTIDMDTWNIISQNCITNFQQDEQTFLIQTAIPPQRHNEVSISELTDSQDDISVKEKTHQESNFDLHEENTSRQGQRQELVQMTHLSGTVKELCAPNLESNSIDYCLSDLVNNKIVESEVAISSEEDDGNESVDYVVFSVMEDILNKSVMLSNKDCRYSSLCSNDSQAPSDSENTLTESVSLEQDALLKWDELNELNHGKKYHPKRLIQNEVSIELEEYYDSKTLLNVVKQYLSSGSESENCIPETAERVEDKSDLHKITLIDTCALYEPFSDDSDSTEELSHYNTAMSKSVLSETSEVSCYSSAQEIQETIPVCGVKCCTIVNSSNGQILPQNVESFIDNVKAGHTSDKETNDRKMLLDHGEDNSSDQSDCDTKNRIENQLLPQSKATAGTKNITQPTAQSKWVNRDPKPRQTTFKVTCFPGGTTMRQTAPVSIIDEHENPEVLSQCKGNDIEPLSSQSESVADGSGKDKTNANYAERNEPYPNDVDRLFSNIAKTFAAHEQKRYPKIFHLDNHSNTEVISPNKTSVTANEDGSCLTHQNHSLANDNLADVYPHDKYTSKRDDTDTIKYQRDRLALETILPPDLRQIPESFDDSVSGIVCSGVLPCISYQSVIDATSSQMFPSETSASIVLPVLDLTTAETVSSLLGALTHVVTPHVDQGDSDSSISRGSMDTLLKQFSNVAIPGDQERHGLNTHSESLSSLLDSLAGLPEPIYYGMYSSSSIRLRPHPVTVQAYSTPDFHPLAADESVRELMCRSSRDSMANVDTPITRGSFVTRSVQTDDLDLHWRTLSTSEIHLGISADQLSNRSEPSTSSNSIKHFGSKGKSDTSVDPGRAEEVCSSASSLDTEMTDLPYVGDAERQSVADLAIYTEVLMSYSTQDKLAELMSTLDAMLAAGEETQESEGCSNTFQNAAIESNRKVVIMSLVSCAISVIMLGVFSLPNVYE